HTTIVDDCDAEFSFPNYYLVIKGEHGAPGEEGNARIIIHPDGPLKLQSLSIPFEERVYIITKIFFCLFNRRAEALKELQFSSICSDILEIVGIGLLEMKPREKQVGNLDLIRVTKMGKKYIKRFERD